MACYGNAEILPWSRVRFATHIQQPASYRAKAAEWLLAADLAKRMTALHNEIFAPVDLSQALLSLSNADQCRQYLAIRIYMPNVGSL